MEPKDRLPDEIIRTLRQFGLPFEGMIRTSDLVKAKIFKAGDYHKQERLEAVGFPSGRWLGANTKIWMPEEIGRYLLNLPLKRPKLPDYAKASAKPQPKVSAKKAHQTFNAST